LETKFKPHREIVNIYRLFSNVFLHTIAGCYAKPSSACARELSRAEDEPDLLGKNPSSKVILISNIDIPHAPSREKAEFDVFEANPHPDLLHSTRSVFVRADHAPAARLKL
jgi:hypothetical protein